MEVWILSRLAAAVGESNKGFHDYDFPTVTTAIYNFWLYELCDVYLEYLKPIMYGDNEERKTLCRNVLYTCLETGLRLLNPFMPFLTEELWQRLPRRPQETALSICVSQYPDSSHMRRNESVEEQLKVVQELVRIIRNLKQDYLPPKARPQVHLSIKESNVEMIVDKFRETIVTLSQIKELTTIAGATSLPSGCTMDTMGSQCEVYMQVEGLVDTDKEIKRLQDMIDKKNASLQKIRDLTLIDGYEEKVPIEVRNTNQEKMNNLTAEMANLTRALEGFRSFQKQKSIN
jgi:valyl-tRNA synthetase